MPLRPFDTTPMGCAVAMSLNTGEPVTTLISSKYLVKTALFTSEAVAGKEGVSCFDGDEARPAEARGPAEARAAREVPFFGGIGA